MTPEAYQSDMIFKINKEDALKCILAKIIWNFFETREKTVPFGPHVFGLIIGSKPVKRKLWLVK